LQMANGKWHISRGGGGGDCGRGFVVRTLTPAPLPSDGRGGELLWGRNPGRRSFLACPGLVCVTLSGFLGRERWRRFGVNGRESRGKKVSVSILWLGLGRHASPPGCAGTTPVDRGITRRRCGVRAGSRCASTSGYRLSSLWDGSGRLGRGLRYWLRWGDGSEGGGRKPRAVPRKRGRGIIGGPGPIAVGGRGLRSFGGRGWCGIGVGIAN